MQLTNKYYSVVSAAHGREAIEVALNEKPDLILMDIMMPYMDGFEATFILKSKPRTKNIPIIIVTALDNADDRVKGLKCGADDFLTKPIDDKVLSARIASLLRTKSLMDELRLRNDICNHIGNSDTSESGAYDDSFSPEGVKVILIDDDAAEAKLIHHIFADRDIEMHLAQSGEDLMKKCSTTQYDLMIFATGLAEEDALRIFATVQSEGANHNVPALFIVDESDRETIYRGLELGANDYIPQPINPEEFIVRAMVQIKKKLFIDGLRDNYEQSISMSMTDPLTGLFNRGYLDQYLDNTMTTREGDVFSLMILDIDHFKSVNDAHGHQAGDTVLQEIATLINSSIRDSDMCARYGGEEFVVIMHKIYVYELAVSAAEKIRQNIEKKTINLSTVNQQINCTVSIGVSLSRADDDAETILKRADDNLYMAKSSGRNRVVLDQMTSVPHQGGTPKGSETGDEERKGTKPQSDNSQSDSAPGANNEKGDAKDGGKGEEEVLLL